MAARAEAGEGEAAAFRVSMDVHRRVLAAKSRFFAEKLRRSGTHSVEILECDDVAVYVEAVVLMYCDELNTKLLGMEVSKILTLLKVSPSNQSFWFFTYFIYLFFPVMAYSVA